MKKSLSISIIAILMMVVSMVSFAYQETILIFLINIDVNKFNFLSIYLLICLVYVLLPLPVTLIILLNGYLFKDVGFYISISTILLASTILFFLSRSIEKFFNLNIKGFFLKKNIDIEKLTSNSSSVLISRWIVPFFFHNIYYGLTSVNFRKFVTIIFLSEIPMTYALNSIGKSLKNFTLESNYSIFDLFIDKNFYIPFIVIIFIFFFIKYIRKNL
tara:strand:+ start:1549 stop:2196 length:648 start_codon:yes stop_codon:yes gene_type:complete